MNREREELSEVKRAVLDYESDMGAALDAAFASRSQDWMPPGITGHASSP